MDLEWLDWRIPSAEAFLPYALALTATTALIAAAARQRAALTLALLGVLVLGVPRLGRVTSDPQPAASGPTLTIATSNVYVGEGDAARLTRLVRRDRVDVLAVQENTPGFDAAARRAGLRTLLPYGVSVPDPRPGAAGLALYARWPLRRIAAAREDRRSLGGLVSVPGGRAVHVRSVHPPPPFSDANVRCWRRCTEAFSAALQPTGNAILAGDFNATLDHHPMRRLMARGLRDVAEERGLGWRPTWSNGSWGTLTIDHVLVSRRVAVLGVAAHDLPGTDHDVLVTRLRLPR